MPVLATIANALGFAAIALGLSTDRMGDTLRLGQEVSCRQPPRTHRYLPGRTGQVTGQSNKFERHDARSSQLRLASGCGAIHNLGCGTTGVADKSATTKYRFLCRKQAW